MGKLRFQAIEFGRNSVWTLGVTFTLRFTESGNLELWNTSALELVWQSGTAGERLVMQEDGNLVIYDRENRPQWASDTSGARGAFLLAGDDGLLEIISEEGALLWRAPTAMPAATEPSPPALERDPIVEEAPDATVSASAE